MYEVGDNLAINYLGFETREVTVTQDMFGNSHKRLADKEIPVKTISSTAYRDSIISSGKSKFAIPDM